MRIISLFFVLLLTAMPLTASAEVLLGDVDCSGKVDITDVTVLIDYLLTKNASALDLDAADVNGDGQVSIADVVDLIDMILLATPIPDDDEHEWVDLGLPSGTLWATCNVGANAPEEYGDYFAWGETEPKELYDWSTYKWCNGSNTTITKYCTNSSYGYNGFVDGKTELDSEDDAATANWGSSWRTPSVEQLNEICAYCSQKWFEINGVRGKLITGPNGNTLFFPAAGSYYSSQLGIGSSGDYWSRSRSLYSDTFANYLIIEGFYVGYRWSGDCRQVGRSVRAVRVTQE